MTLTVLFDLDDTLLVNPMDQFMRSYIPLLAKSLSPYVSPEIMVPRLLTSTEKMIQKDYPCDTLELTFDSDFYPNLNLSKNDLRKVLSDFYENSFPSLRSITSPIPAAVMAVKHAFEKGYRVVIATNPLFPIRAIEHRLEWAGLPVAKYPFNLVTSYEKMHFAKPNPAYYAEILGILGWQDEPACVIGNSISDDILPAGALGIPGYLIANQGDDTSRLPPLSRIGNHDGLIDWMDQIAEKGRLPEFSTPGAIKAVLKSTPAIMSFLTSRLSQDNWQKKPIENEWSVLETVCHFRDVEKEVNLSRLTQFLSEENPFIAGVDSDPWVRERNYNSLSTPSAFLDFCAHRTVLLENLQTLNLDDWEKTGRHSIFGPTTLSEQMRFITTHDRNHLNQLSNTISAMEIPIF